MSTGKSVDLQEIGKPIREGFERFAQETGRELRLEVEPGTYLVANSCSLVATVQDMTSTGQDGYEFIKSDTGMTETIRPAMYGAQHPAVVVNSSGHSSDNLEPKPYIISGHCCEASAL